MNVFGAICFIAFVATVPIANWLIGNVGTVCVPNGPCLIPVGFGFDAPSGVLVAGLAFVLRDLVQRSMGLHASIAAIMIGGAASGFVAPLPLVAASTLAFLLSELADLLVYTPLRKRGFIKAVVASSAVGLVVDSVLFLSIAFGSLKYLPGQIIGKMWAVAFAVAMIKLVQVYGPRDHSNWTRGDHA